MSTKTALFATAGWLSNTRTTPPCSTTNQRVALPGACSIMTGLENDGRPGKTRSVASVTVCDGRSPATHVGLSGLASSPPVAAAAAPDSADSFGGDAESKARTA